MPNDFLTLTALTKELSDVLTGGKIEKIYQPEKDEIMLTVHKGGKHNLVISCNAETPRIHLTSIKKENPYQAPAFCMHLRKLISGGIIEDISLVNYDRIISIAVSAKNELKDTVKYRIAFEMMGRYSNTLLISDNDKILDAIKQVSFDTATKRCILPGMKYTFPEQSKLLPFDYDGIRNCLRSYSGGALSKYISANISGIAPISADELVRRAECEDKDSLTDGDIDGLIEEYRLLYNINSSDSYSPSTLQTGKGMDYFILPYFSLSDKFASYDSLSLAVEACVAKKDGEERHREKTKHLNNALKKFKARNVKKLQKAKEKLIECENMELYRKYGELINCNLYKIDKGASAVTVTDYYDENMADITIPLDCKLSAGANAQSYFKRYNKLKRTLAVIKDQIRETEELIIYAESIESGINTSLGSNELLQIEEELYAVGALKKMKSKTNKNSKPAAPYMYEYNDFVISVGKNNIQNDRLTFKTANGGDLWLHALGYHGSHVIVFAEAREIPDDVIQVAAEIAGYYSQGNGSASIPVDYTRRRNVKRNPSGNPGMVTYTGQQTAYVIPNQHKECLKN